VKENLFQDGSYFGMPEKMSENVTEEKGRGKLPKKLSEEKLQEERPQQEKKLQKEKSQEELRTEERLQEDKPQETKLKKELSKEMLPGKNLLQQAGIQIISSGPDTGNRQIRNNYLELFYKAKHHIYIQTPYFVPDDAVLSALTIAAGSGLDVRLMIPCKPDHPFVYWATYSYVKDLLEAGAKCYTYEHGFLHAKGVMVDGMASCYGTANMDIRSFELNFEVNAIIFDAEVTGRLEDIFIKDLEHCREVTRQNYEERSLVVRVKEQCSRLLSPLL
jgi:cardiolipin synthase